MKKLISVLLALAMTAMVFAGCSDETVEIATMEPTEEALQATETTPDNVVTVSTTEEFLAALGSNTTIRLSAGEYLLSQASDYGKLTDNPAYFWETAGEGYQLKLNHLHDLVIEGAGIEETTLLTQPRYSNVLALENCQNIRIRNLTAGHTEGGELCNGGVVDLYGCTNVGFDTVGLFGCGIWGVSMYACDNIGLDNSRIYDCSVSGLQIHSTQNVQVNHTDFYTIGSSREPGSSIVTVEGSQKIQLKDCSISENNVMNLVSASYSPEISLLNCEFRANRAIRSAFDFQDCQPLFSGCSLEGNDVRKWYSASSMPAVDEKGASLTEDHLPEIVEPDPENLPEQQTVTVKTVDEFLAAIGPDREIILSGDIFDLSTASSDGPISPYWYWEDPYDGAQLVITDVSNMTIKAEGEDRKATTLQAVPRYANVLSFRSCTDITLSGFTAGHSEEPGYCMGGVLDFRDCRNVIVNRCGLFGCGILGVNAELCSNLTVLECDIYECSYGGIQLFNVDDVVISSNTFRDLGGPEVMTQDCTEVNCDVPTNQWPEGVG